MTCFDCKWCTGETLRNEAQCDWLYKSKIPQMPPFLRLYNTTTVAINIGTEACYPKWVAPSMANECKCYEKKV